MKKYQPLVLQKLNIRVGGIHIRQLALHRHLPETTSIRLHSHKYAQCLLYLSGQGREQIGQRTYAIQIGSAIFLPPGINHAFLRQANRRPICLVVDFDWRGSCNRPVQATLLSLAALREIRQQISTIAHISKDAEESTALMMSATILRLLNSLLTATALIPAPSVSNLSPVSRRVDRLLTQADSTAIPLSQLAQRAGYQHDYLNRVLKSHAGLTLGQFRAQKLLSRAQLLLREAKRVVDVSEALGFADPNYFSRWFRKQTGTTPLLWRRQNLPR